jgi:hypothetical protein
MLGFHTKQLTERGGDQAPFEFALGAREQLGLDVRFFVPADVDWIVPEAQRRFEEHFDVFYYSNPREIACDALYVHKRGLPGRITPHLPELNHAWGSASHPHGHRFAVTSDWLASTAKHQVRIPRVRTIEIRKVRKPPVVPNIVCLPAVEEDLRSELGIPDDAVVFGRHGPVGVFDIDFVKAAIRVALDERRDLWFAFLNLEPFYEHERIAYLPRTVDRVEVRRFVNTCDYMVHARSLGEGFGLAVAEFAMIGAPVLTFLESPALAHLDLLPNGLLLGYRSHEDVLGYFLTLPRRTSPVANDIVERYSPESVMPRFRDVFLR